MSARTRIAQGAAWALFWATALPPALAQTPKTSSTEVYEASISELQSALAAGRTTSVALVNAYLARIAAYDQKGPALNAIIRLNPSALADAEASDRERTARGPRGPLHGIPILVKDNYEVAGLPTSNGSVAFANWVPTVDAYTVARLREAGAIILGMTNMHEFASGITTISSIGGQTRNPYDPSRNPGGSSGGTGAAIAASFAALGWGSDTCGSIRIPASHQNLFGLRPTKGLFNTAGIFPLSHTQDVPGPLARDVTDLALGLDATLPAGSSIAPGRFLAALDTSALRGLRVGLLKNFFTTVPEELEIIRVLRPVIDSMKAHGAEVVEVTLPVELDTLVARASVIPYEYRWDLADFLDQRPAAQVHSIAEILGSNLYHASRDAGLRASDTVSSRDTPQYRAALGQEEALRQIVLRAFEDGQVDALIYPTIRRKAATLGEPQYGTTCGLSATIGFPAITMPAGLTRDGLPVGLEAMGRPLTDDRLVAVAYAFEHLFQPRRAPYSTPALVNGRAPEPVTITVDVRGPNGERALGRFTFDITRSTLDYRITIEGERAQNVEGLTLNQIVAEKRAPVLYRLSPGGSLEATGTVSLSFSARQALLEGRLQMVLFTRGTPDGTIRGSLALPKR